MQLADDIIEDVLEHVRQVCPAFSDDQAREVDRRARQVWGGTEPYVYKGVPRRIVREETDHELRNGRSIDAASARLGVHRSTIYRILKKR